MKILEHLVTAPAANESDGVEVNVTQEEVHPPTSGKVTGGDVVACGVKVVEDGVVGGADCGGEIGAPDGAPPGDHPDIA